MNKLKEIRKAAGLSLEELAKQCGTSRGHVHCLETERGNPSLKLAYRVAAILGKQVQEIWPDENEVIEELQSWLDLGYGEKPVYWMNLNTQEMEEVEKVDIISDGSGIEIR